MERFKIHTGLGKTVQTKLSVGKPDDQYEKEADAVADKVMMMPEGGVDLSVPMSPNSSPGVNMKMKEDDEESLQLKPLMIPDPKSEQVVSASFEKRLKENRGNGETLSPETRFFMEKRMDADFGEINIHSDSEANRLTDQIGAKAFTVGNDIFFNSNQYSPHSTQGKHLLSHELTHSLQQKGGETIQKLEVPGWARSIARGAGVAFRLTLRDEGSMYAKALMRHYLIGGGETFNPEEFSVNFPTDSMWSDFMAGRPEIQRRMLVEFQNQVIAEHASGNRSGSFSFNVTNIRLNELESMRWTLHGAHRIEVSGNFSISDTELNFSRESMAPTTRRTNPRVTFSNVRMVWVDVGDMHPGTVTETDSGEEIDDSEFTAAGNSYPIQIPFYMPGESVWEIAGGTATKLRGWPNPSEATSTRHRE